MSGQAKGSFESRVLTDASKSFHLRFQLNGKRDNRRPARAPWLPLRLRWRLGGGGRAGRARGVGLRPLPRPMSGPTGPGEDNGSVPTFAEYAAWWLEAKIAGVLGDHPTPGTLRRTTAPAWATSPTSAPTGWTRSTLRCASS